MGSGVGEIFVEGAGKRGCEGHCRVADGEVIDVIAQSCGEDESIHRAGFGLFGEGFANLFDGVICGIDRGVA